MQIKKTRSILFLAMLMIGVVASLAAPLTGAQKVEAAQATRKAHQLIPMYIYPFWWQADNDWYRVCDSMNPSGNGSTAIMNPNNGPGDSYNSDYDYVINHCHQTGNNVIGYVDTNYGTVPIETVKANIDSYYAWYNTNTATVDSRIDGIFLDQMSNDPITADYYHEIYLHIKAKSVVNDDVVGNPGSPALTDWQLNDEGLNSKQAADEIVIFEGPTTGQYGLSSYVKPAWANNYPASDISMLVYGVAESDIANVCSQIKRLGSGLVDVTSADITPYSTPWNSLQSASYWTSFRTSCG